MNASVPDGVQYAERERGSRILPAPLSLVTHGLWYTCFVGDKCKAVTCYIFD